MSVTIGSGNAPGKPSVSAVKEPVKAQESAKTPETKKEPEKKASTKKK